MDGVSSFAPELTDTYAKISVFYKLTFHWGLWVAQAVTNAYAESCAGWSRFFLNVFHNSDSPELIKCPSIKHAWKQMILLLIAINYCC